MAAEQSEQLTADMRFERTVDTEEKAEEIVGRHRRAEINLLQIFDWGAIAIVGVPEGRELRFSEKLEAEEEVRLATPVMIMSLKDG